MNALDLSETDAMSNYTHQHQKNQQGLHCKASGLTLQQAFPSKPLGLHRRKPATGKDKYLQKGRGRDVRAICSRIITLKTLQLMVATLWIEGRNPAGNGGFMWIEGRNPAAKAIPN